MMMQWKDDGLHCGILWCLLRMMFWVVKGKYITTGSWRIGSALSHWWIDAISAIAIGCRLASIKAMYTTLGIRMLVGRLVRRCDVPRTNGSGHMLIGCSSLFASARIWACAHVFRNAKSGYKSNMCPSIRMENGEFCGLADEQVMRWHRHFSGVLQNVSFKHDILDDLPQ